MKNIIILKSQDTIIGAFTSINKVVNFLKNYHKNLCYSTDTYPKFRGVSMITKNERDKVVYFRSFDSMDVNDLQKNTYKVVNTFENPPFTDFKKLI